MADPVTYMRFQRVRPATLPPEGFVDFYWSEESGSFVTRDSSGTESAVAGATASGIDPTALEFAGVNPNVASLIVSGGPFTDGTDPVVFPEMLFYGDYLSHEAYSSDGLIPTTQPSIFWSVGDAKFILQASPTAQWIDNSASSTIAAITTMDPVSAETGTATVTITPLAATHLGQWCKASTAWWQWNGFFWIPRFTLAGDPIAYNATLSAYRKLVVSGADGSEIITISAL